MYWLSVDPGIGGTGVAYWKEGQLLKATTLRPKYVPNSSWEKNVTNISSQFAQLVASSEAELAIFEAPVFFSGAGRVVAESGDLCKLAMLCGMYIYIVGDLQISYQLITPAHWKGQLPKKVAATRIEKEMGRDFPTERLSNHAVDAIGIGLWHLGRFK